VLIAGWVENLTSITAVIVGGAVWAVVLALWSNPKVLRKRSADV
jgi:hypothetical protein